jgi:hypothetical protein
MLVSTLMIMIMLVAVAMRVYHSGDVKMSGARAKKEENRMWIGKQRPAWYTTGGKVRSNTHVAQRTSRGDGHR